MATSSSDESSTAPKEYQLSSSTDSGSRIFFNKQKCLLCCNARKVFHCKDCVHNGLFYHSKQQAAESFLDKRKTLLELDDKKKLLVGDCLKHLETRRKADVLRSKIKQYRERNRIIKLAVEEKRQKRANYIADLNRLREDVKTNTEKLKRYDDKVFVISHRFADRSEKIDMKREELDVKYQETMRMVKLRIDQLMKHVFPISTVEPKIETESFESEMISALAEASQDTKNKWEYTDYSGELQYSIVEPTLPGSGNYSLYNVWVSQNKDAVPVQPNQELVEHNPAFTISAALTYTAQLIHVLAFYLNVRLPYRMVYSDFCGGYMEEAQFNRRVHRINANILYLCSTQNMDLRSLKPCETIRNLLKLTDTNNPYLGRQGPIEVDNDTADLLEQSLNRAMDGSDENTDTDEGDNFHKEWETVPHIPCQEIPAGPSVQSAQMITTQQATSMAGGLVTSAAASIASMWRGFTGR